MRAGKWLQDLYSGKGRQVVARLLSRLADGRAATATETLFSWRVHRLCSRPVTATLSRATRPLDSQTAQFPDWARDAPLARGNAEPFLEIADPLTSCD